MAQRRLENWLEGWMEYTAGLPSPELWRLWGGISIVSAVLERKVHIRTGIGPLYPNMYIVLVGPPGTGKTVIVAKARYLWQQLVDLKNPNEGFHLSASSTTSASIIDDLREADRRIIRMSDTPPTVDYNALTICSTELGVLLPEYDNAMMNKLTDIYDGHPYSERRRTKDLNFQIEAPQLNMLAACTPGYLTDVLPPGAWDQGFLSRTMLAFSTENLRREIFSEIFTDSVLESNLIADLRHIFNHENVFGAMTMEPEARKALENWHKAGGPPQPEHPRLMHYLTRRTTHLLKLCMVASVVENDSRIITKENLDTALGWLLELEIPLNEIFRAMVVGGDAQAMQETWFHFAKVYQDNGQRPIAEMHLVEFLGARVPSHSVVRILEIMEKSGMLRREVMAFGNAYHPRQRKPI
jgi:hypothetical protein